MILLFFFVCVCVQIKICGAKMMFPIESHCNVQIIAIVCDSVIKVMVVLE